MKKKVLLTFIFLLFAIIMINNKSLAFFEVSNFEIDAEVDEQGDMTVTENIKYYTNEDTNGVTRDIELKNSDNVENSADGIELIEVSSDGLFCREIPVGYGEKGDDLVYEYTRNNGSYQLKLYSPFTGYKTVTYIYKLKNVAVKYDDTAEIYWNFIGSGWDSKIKNLNINITLPMMAADQTSYVFGHGSDNGEFTKDGNYITLSAKNIKAHQAVDARVLFSRDSIPYSNKTVNKSVLNEYINQEEGMAKAISPEIAFGLNIFEISMFFIVLIIICAIYIYFKYDKEDNVEKPRYYREIPFGLEPEILQYFYYGKIVSSSYYIAVLNLIKLGVYRIEKGVNKVGKEVEKLIYNKNHTAKLKPYQEDIVYTINDYIDETEEKSIDFTALDAKMSNSSHLGYESYERLLKVEKESLVGKAKKGSVVLPIALIILLILAIAACSVIISGNGSNALFIMMFMAFLTIVYSTAFINTKSSSFVNIFLFFHCSCFQIPLIIMMVTNGIGWLYISYLLAFILIIYSARVEKLSKEEKQIIEYTKGLRRYIKHYSLLSEKEELNNVIIWEDYFILAIALKLNNQIINYFYNYSKDRIDSNLGAAMLCTNSYLEFNTIISRPFYSYRSNFVFSTSGGSDSGGGFSGSSGGFSGGSSSGGGGGRRWRRKSFLKQI